MFLLPGFVIVYYVTETPILEEQKVEMINYIFARQAKDGGWGLHIEGDSTVFGISMNYVALRLLGVDAEDPRMVKARKLLHEFGGSVNGPHWLKFWLAVLGVVPWTLVNPVPPELWYVIAIAHECYAELTHDKAASRLDTNFSLALVDTYANGLSINVVHRLQEMVIQADRSHASFAL